MTSLPPPLHFPLKEELALTVSDLSCAYQGHKVLNQLGFSLERGQILALLGPSGCGKTTLLRAIAGLQPISAGTLVLAGKTLCSNDVFVPAEKRGMGMIFQDYALFPHLTVAQNIVFGLKAKSAREQRQVTEEMLALVRLDGLGHRFPHQLSGGQQQRVAIARALAYEPSLLLLDEPFSNIDAQVRHALMMEMRDILKARQVSAIFVTHSKEEAFVFADQLAILTSGKILQQGKAETLYARPASQYVADYLGAANYLDAKVISTHEVMTALGKVSSPEALTQAIGVAGRLLLRPEYIGLQPNPNGAAHIVSRQFLGYGCEYRVHWNGELLIARSQQEFQCGEQVDISVLVHPLVIFERAVA
ncbi:MAG: ABC transporter ATP-binding protein [Shewanella sp.]